MTLVSLFVVLIVFLLLASFVWWATTRLLTVFGVKDPWSTLIQILVMGILLLTGLSYLGLLPGALRVPIH